MIFSGIAAVQPVRLLSDFLVLYDNAVYDASCQNLPKRGIEAVDVRCNVVPQGNLPPLLLLYHILFDLNTAPQDHKDFLL